MSYLRKIEYEIVPKESFSVIRSCSGCDRKTYFENTNKFRVNANGGKLDVWLIYQCENCKHTLNLAIYKRRKASTMPREEYKCFLSNDEQLAKMYGRNIQLFRENKAEIDFERLNYQFVKLQDITEKSDCRQQIVLTIQNPYRLKIRPEKQIAQVLGLSRSQVKKLLEDIGEYEEMDSRIIFTIPISDLPAL
ncbi:MAG: DUF1062 domain-containing protein [Lachnospiraceae bacterium]|nr:DUF1062 domain-containing protein [Lachnospiraceae bacterium]